MKFLLDTHAFLWFVLDDPRLSAPAADTISNPENEILLSPASYWEIAIKISIGKYSLTESVEEFFEREITTNRFTILPILPRHVGPLAKLPFHHRAPFDRLVIAQSVVEGIPVLSADEVFDLYGVSRIW